MQVYLSLFFLSLPCWSGDSSLLKEHERTTLQRVLILDRPADPESFDTWRRTAPQPPQAVRVAVDSQTRQVLWAQLGDAAELDHPKFLSDLKAEVAHKQPVNPGLWLPWVEQRALFLLESPVLDGVSLIEDRPVEKAWPYWTALVILVGGMAFGIWLLKWALPVEVLYQDGQIRRISWREQWRMKWAARSTKKKIISGGATRGSW